MRIVIGEKEFKPTQIFLRRAGENYIRVVFIDEKKNSETIELEIVLDTKSLKALMNLINNIFTGDKSAQWRRDG